MKPTSALPSDDVRVLLGEDTGDVQQLPGLVGELHAEAEHAAPRDERLVDERGDGRDVDVAARDDGGDLLVLEWQFRERREREDARAFGDELVLLDEREQCAHDFHFDDKENLVIPMEPLKIETDPKELEEIFCEDDFKADYRILNREIRKMGYNIPPLVNAYMNLSPTMKLFGTAINDGFGDVEETGILIAVDEILEEKRMRHIDSYIKDHPEALALTSGANPIIYKETEKE